MKSIPKIVHFYWGNTILPYLRYMTLYSFKKLNPEWKVILHTPTKLSTLITWKETENRLPFNCVSYLDKVEKLGIEIQAFDFEQIGFSNDTSEVIKSDILRMYLLSTIGGLWSDIDILYYKSLTHTFQNTDHTSYFCYRRGGVSQEDKPKNGPLYHIIGFLMANENNKHFKLLFDNIKSNIEHNRYQSIGSSYYSQYINMNDPNIFNIDIQTLYPIRSPQVMFSYKAIDFNCQLSPHTIGIHWYGGHPHCGANQNIINEDNYHTFDNIICKKIKDLVNA